MCIRVLRLSNDKLISQSKQSSLVWVNIDMNLIVTSSAMRGQHVVSLVRTRYVLPLNQMKKLSVKSSLLFRVIQDLDLL